MNTRRYEIKMVPCEQGVAKRYAIWDTVKEIFIPDARWGGKGMQRAVKLLNQSQAFASRKP